MIATIDADDAWWPPTFTPEAVARTLLAWWTMLVASQSTRRCDGRRARRADDGAIWARLSGRGSGMAWPN